MSTYELSVDPSRLPVETVYAAIMRLYACAAPSRDGYTKAVENSINFAVYSPDGELAAYARVISDLGSFAAVTDAFVLEAHRGQGLAKLLVDAISAHPGIAGLPLHALGASPRGFFSQCGRSLSDPSHPILEIGPASV
ncbi:MAG TPA: GNAT family N-acetyltransferase [Bryobacteraceae bacterium]|nr:GNAT family N-acetyltransferase [Bryobacteraceae bacterium]